MSLNFYLLISLRILQVTNMCMSACSMLNHWVQKFAWNFAYGITHVHEQFLFSLDNISPTLISQMMGVVRSGLLKFRGLEHFGNLGGRWPKGGTKCSGGLNPGWSYDAFGTDFTFELQRTFIALPRTSSDPQRVQMNFKSRGRLQYFIGVRGGSSRLGRPIWGPFWPVTDPERLHRVRRGFEADWSSPI